MSKMIEEKSIKEKTIAEANRCFGCFSAKCMEACPLHNDIPKMTTFVKEGAFEKAYEENKKTNPLGAICGIVCPHEKLCEGACIRGQKDGNVKIGAIESGICLLNSLDKTTDSLANNNIDKVESKVAIIGGGPSGISCAYFLARQNISSTIFEKESYLGGILMYGIPEFRLDKDIVQNAISKITSNELIKVEYNKVVAREKQASNQITLDELISEGFEYIFYAIGNETSKELEIEGVDSKNVLNANEFLKNPVNDLKGKKVVTIGGGNVAIDCSRVAKSLGADSLIVYRKKRENMPANVQEVQEAENEGVEFFFQKNVIKIKSKEDGTLVLFLDDDSQLETDYFIMAIGSKINEEYFDKKITIQNDKVLFNDCYETNIKNVFVGGDLVSNKNTVVNAIATGKKVAEEIAHRIEL